MGQKADRKELKELEDQLIEKMLKLLEELMSRFSDRDETNRSLKNFEKSIRSFVEKSSFTSPRKDEEETALLAKKPLGGWSCASCEKDLVNISGRVPGYQAWSKLPFRVPGERIAKVGQGFSKMLALVNPNQTFVSQGLSTNYQTTKQSGKVPPLRDFDQGQDSIPHTRMSSSTQRDFSSNRFPKTMHNSKANLKPKKQF